MYDLLKSPILFVAAEALPQLASEVRHPSAGMFLFGGRREDGERKPYTLQSGIATITIRGALSQYGGFWTTGYEQIRENIRTALADSAVKAILLNINSPGGAEAGLFELADWIHAVHEQKPMYAYADAMMCSAAYCIASSTGTILAPRMATVGSVGVVMMHTDWSKWNEKTGIAYTCLHAGEFKIAGNQEQPLSDRDRSYFQARLNQSYSVFLQSCQRGMGLDPAKATEWADGKIFHGDEAQSLGLVSAIVRDRDDAMAHILSHISTTEKDMNLKEIDLDTLQKENPELHAQLIAQAQASAGKGTQEDGKGTELSAPANPAATVTSSEDAAFEASCAMLEATGAKAQAEAMRKMKAAGLSFQQMAAVAPMLADAQLPDTSDAPAMQKQLLTALNNSESLKPVGQQPGQKAKTTAQAQTDLVSELSGLEV